MSTTRRSVGATLIILVLTLFFSLPTDTKSVAKPGETSLGISEQKAERHHLVEPALWQLIEFRNQLGMEFQELAKKLSKKTAELALPSGLASSQPQTDPTLADGADNQEELIFLVELYAAKYGIDEQTLEEIVEKESHHNPEATGREGERGLGQFLLGTWLTTA